MSYKFLDGHRFNYTAKILKNREGKKLSQFKGNFYVLQTFLPGRVVTSWDNINHFKLAQLKNQFAFSAKFSKAVKGYKTKIRFQNKPLYFFVKNGAKLFVKSFASFPKNQDKIFLERHKLKILRFIKTLSAEFTECRYDGLPKQLVHFDLHPGNMHFIKNKVVGLFDFDWVRFDSRIFGHRPATISQSCYYYGGKNSGLYRKDRIFAGLGAYRKSYGKSEFKLPLENQLIKNALKAYNFYQLLFVMGWYKQNYHKRYAECRMALRQFTGLILKNDYERLFNF